jgi:muconate cycloisomerase
MRITHIEKWQVVVPCREGLLEREGRWFDPGLSTFDAVPKWIIRIHTDTGYSGVGESVRGETMESIDAGIAALLGIDPRTLCLQQLPLPPVASYTTFEMAVFDLLGNAWGVPVYQLLGGARQERVQVDYWASRRSVEDTAKEARAGRDLGFHGIKIKAALASPIVPDPADTRRSTPGDHTTYAAILEDDPIRERVAAIAAAAGPDFTITVDPNCRLYDPERALRIARQLAEFKVLALEDPIPWKGNLDTYARLRREWPVPVAIHVFTPDAVLEAIRKEAVDYFNINGSMVDFVRMAWLAEQAGLRCWHGSGVDLGVRDMSYVHASLAAGNCTLPGDIVGNFLRVDDLVNEPISIIDGAIPRPTAPGLGVTLDEAALCAFTMPVFKSPF